MAMTVRDFAGKLGMAVLTGDHGLDREVSGMYACDLLSWVMSHASRGDAWVTVHTNLNIVAVALLSEISCIIIPESIQVDTATLKKACEEGLPVLSTDKDVYTVCWKAHELLDGGCD